MKVLLVVFFLGLLSSALSEGPRNDEECCKIFAADPEANLLDLQSYISAEIKEGDQTLNGVLLDTSNLLSFIQRICIGSPSSKSTEIYDQCYKGLDENVRKMQEKYRENGEEEQDTTVAKRGWLSVLGKIIKGVIKVLQVISDIIDYFEN